jgi:sorting nexin-29
MNKWIYNYYTNIQVELIKFGGEDLYKYLLQLIRRVWNKESLPDEWRMGILCPIHKKGDPLDCKNYQGISLLSSTYKVLSNILYSCLLPFVKKESGSYQAGFRGGKSTTDQIFSL